MKNLIPSMQSKALAEHNQTSSKVWIQNFNVELLKCFNTLKTYGKEGKSYEIIFKTYYENLMDMDGKKILEALKYWIQNENDFPTINEIRQYVIQHTKRVLSAEEIAKIKENAEKRQREHRAAKERFAQECKGNPFRYGDDGYPI